MKRLVVAAVFAMGGAAHADVVKDRATAMHQIASVLAAVNLCPKIEGQQGMLSLYALANGFTFDPSTDIGKTIAIDAVAQRDGMKGIPTENVCASALMLYGPDGLNVPDLVRVK